MANLKSKGYQDNRFLKGNGYGVSLQCVNQDIHTQPELICKNKITQLDVCYLLHIFFSSTEITDLAIYTARLCGHGSAVRLQNGKIICKCDTEYGGVGCEKGTWLCGVGV